MRKTHNFHETFLRSEPSLPSDRSTGLVFATVSFAVAVFWRHNETIALFAGGVGLFFVLISMLVPRAIRPLNIVWMRFAHLLAMVMNPIVMFVLFVALFVPAGLIFKWRSDPLRRRKDLNADTYWVTRRPDESSALERQF